MKRRDILLGAGAAALTLPAAAQQPARAKRIGFLHYLAAADAEAQTYHAVLLQALQEAGWTVGRNLRIDYRWTGGDTALIRGYVRELAALNLDLIFTAGGTYVSALRQEIRTTPIVFVQVADAVGLGLVESLARPGGNATGFTNFEFSISSKWLELLKEMAPKLRRVGMLRDPANPSGPGQFGAIQVAAAALQVEAFPLNVSNAADMERTIAAFATTPDSALIAAPHGPVIANRDLIVALAARHRLPAIYPFRFFALAGGLMAYGPDPADQYRLAAGYVDRILRGTNPADLPVQQPSRIEFTINQKTATALGLAVPQTLLVMADDVVD